jgi:hypothetical protein
MLIGEPTSFTAPEYGLLTTATELDFPSDNTHWKMGVVWEPLCPDVDGTYAPCIAVTETAGEIVPVPETPVPKPPTFADQIQGATPFTAYARIDCSPVGSWDELPNWGRLGLQRAEEQFVENVFWTGLVNGTTVAYPHLAANADRVDGEDLLQMAATVVTTEPQDLIVGIGMLEQAMRDCYPGQATLHVPLRLASQLADGMNLITRGGKAQTAAGSSIVLGAGYPGTAPDGTTDPGVTWIYATGPVFFIRDSAVQFRREDSLDRTVNTVSMITERTYVVGFSCCLLAIPILNGELPA